MILMENDWLQVEFSSSGAEVRKVAHKKNGLDYMWTGDSAYWGRVSPVLFPIVGRLKENRYELDGQTYEMSQHGFLRDVEFTIHDQTATKISFQFQSAGRYTDVYPYEFTAIIHYTLQEDSLTVKWEIVNENNETMYFSIGAHPAFLIPLLENERVEDYHVHLTPAGKVTQYELKNSFIHEKGMVHDFSTIQLTNDLFANDALIYSNIDQVELLSSKSNHGVTVLLEKFPFVGIWSKYIEEDGTIAPFVCIEPWYGIADTQSTTGNLKEKFGMNSLEVSQTFQAEYTMTFK
ncbi:aldose 1-epimerase family protein [Cytobacillus spongiae]|uniref:aldose 1-epimerase family protein n=1 Tax=Cytobacillus spongiae TaxID=2901381 RepID=UPI001F1D46D6|nr:aldose 1-epimerase family protein [Cytobacillus spongiae]UII54161.1 aldose 1-epimerase family protein [Cytobacillus spongiae]